ncbi:L-ascorbate metabolism protein UlaG, beta-lactamase superfamily [Nonlabens sp. Hel1_33_55]|uniref:MBL fold metallo-hydrolase n=1 Tax=Nonlabens sp. Hel1_33_55 TaxID=1336802 RepID=UPI000875B916|nr:MBL fold metallo-hydrolase [Nonlabens sp. Hel1_33_55]SCY17633.1 L-ascorbate metabolism protein UlaG, beta-lactamase superfamily [Nonlabens sp. Hel1_33_55]
MKNIMGFLLMLVLFSSCKEKEETTMDTADNQMEQEEMAMESDEMPNIEIMPISHATFVMNWNDKVIYLDPVGGASAFEGMPPADMILITHTHGDHMAPATLKAVMNDNAMLFAPQAVADKLGADFDTTVLNNGDSEAVDGITVNAVAMYNITKGRLNNHPEGVGNGYVIESDGYRVYVSGDTEGTPEMRSLENIDKAFVCMNLPYTMDVEQAADAVIEFAPVEVIPYHYRGQNGLSDIDKFKSLVNQGNEDIEVTFMNWYPERG